MRRVWITWETQRRNEELARSFGCEFKHFDHSAHLSPVRYLLSGSKTLQLLFGCRGAIVFAQCPSVALSFFVALLRPIFGYTLVIDAHNGAIDRVVTGRGLACKMTRFAFRRAKVVIVSNSYLFQAVQSAGGNPMALPDKLPELRAVPATVIAAKPTVAFVCSFASDEPVPEFLAGAKRVEKPFQLQITGLKRKAGNLLSWESEGVHFTDFLPRDEFDALICQADLVVDLTTRSNCLVCGAYEALAAGKPSLLSDSPASRELFRKGALFAKNSAEEYARALTEFFQNRERLTNEAREYRTVFEKEWALKRAEICNALEIPLSS